MDAESAFEFIRSCVSHRPEATRREHIQAFIEAGIDWNVIRQEATRHGVLPLLYHNLERLLGGDMPSSQHAQIQQYWKVAQIHATFLVRELGRVFRHFEAHDFPLLAMKGPVLAQMAYGDVSMRRYVDLDMLIPRNRFSEADRLLQALGYEVKEEWKGLTGWRRKLALHFLGQWPFRRGNDMFSLDVHTRIMPPGYSFPGDFEPFWQRSRRMLLEEEVAVRGFALEDMILVLCYQGVKNQWRELKHVCDIAGLLRTKPEMDWDLIRERAREIGGTSVLKLGLFMAHRSVNAPLPADIQRWVEADSTTRRIASMMAAYLRNRHRKPELQYRKRVQLQLATKDTIRAQIRYGIHSVMGHVCSPVISPSE